MPWHTKYWDALDQLFWTPKYLGLRSISQREWLRVGGRVSVPESLVNLSGPLYSRAQSAAETIEMLHCNEEVLNHIFDITFAIAPDAVIEASFLKPFGFTDAGPFQSLGRETRARYRWGASANVTQHDGFFVSDTSLVGVELKLGSKSSPAQIAKYVGLLAWEVLHGGKRPNMGLLFIVPPNSVDGHWRHCDLNGPEINHTWLEGREFEKPLPRALAQLFEEQADLVNAILDNLILNVITWADLQSSLQAISQRLDISNPGDQTLDRLLGGFLAQLRAHRGAL